MKILVGLTVFPRNAARIGCSNLPARVNLTEDAKPSLASATAVPASGGSVAGRNYREQLAQQGTLNDAIPIAAQAPPSPPFARPEPAAVNARAAERKKVSGRARVVLPGGAAVVGKMVDMSLTGACVMMEDMLPSGKGFKVGFQFGACNAVATTHLAELVA